MAIEEFGEQLLLTNDLDPVYVALKSNYFQDHPDVLHRWLLAYWCFYHVGVASWMADRTEKDFWEGMEVAARNQTPSPLGHQILWPRGAERRHFRGAAAIESVSRLKEKFPHPEKAVKWLCENARSLSYYGVNEPVTFSNISKLVQSWTGFGPWIAFKVADMMDRVLRVEIRFDQNPVVLYDPPREALKTVADQREESIELTLLYLTSYFSTHLAPPSLDRWCGVQEVETILCKWKSHQNGRYQIGHDIRELREGAGFWVKYSETARAFLDGMPPHPK